MNYIGFLLDHFKESCSRYPLTKEGLEFSIDFSEPNGCKIVHTKGFLVGQEGGSPWDQKYIYISDGISYELKTEKEKRVFLRTDKIKFREITVE